jgi:hypothetical protein
MVDRKVVPFDEFYYQLKLMHLFQKHPVYGPASLNLKFANQIHLIQVFPDFNGNYQKCRTSHFCKVFPHEHLLPLHLGLSHIKSGLQIYYITTFKQTKIPPPMNGRQGHFVEII